MKNCRITRILSTAAGAVALAYFASASARSANAIPSGMGVGSFITTSPQAVTGPWEQLIAGKVVGFNIEVSTAAEGQPKTLVGTRQRVTYIWITTYVRVAGRSQRTTWSTGYPGQFDWENNHIQLHAPNDPMHYAHAMDVDLSFDPAKSKWSGEIHDESYAGPVVLTRPFVPHIGYPIIGDWLDGDAPGYACHHIALGADSSLVIWSDSINLPGYVVPLKGVALPVSAPEWYGELDMDPEVKDVGLNMLFFTGTAMSGDVVRGNVNEPGDVFSGEYAHFGNGASDGKFDPFAWHRTTPQCEPAPLAPRTR